MRATNGAARDARFVRGRQQRTLPLRLLLRSLTRGSFCRASSVIRMSANLVVCNTSSSAARWCGLSPSAAACSTYTWRRWRVLQARRGRFQTAGLGRLAEIAVSSLWVGERATSASFCGPALPVRVLDLLLRRRRRRDAEPQEQECPANHRSARETSARAADRTCAEEYGRN